MGQFVSNEGEKQSGWKSMIVIRYKSAFSLGLCWMCSSGTTANTLLKVFMHAFCYLDAPNIESFSKLKLYNKVHSYLTQKVHSYIYLLL